MNNCLENAIKACWDKQALQLEKLAAAFVLEVGFSEASQYELVQETKTNETVWYFRKRLDNSNSM